MEAAQPDSTPDDAQKDSDLTPDASSPDMPEDMLPDLSTPDASPDMCALDCACGGSCTNGVVTIVGTGDGWEGPCGEEPECSAPYTYQCPNGCAAGAPTEGDDPTTFCAEVPGTQNGDWSAFCAPE